MQPGIGVVGLEISAGHVDLAAYFQHLRPALAFEHLRDHADLAQIGTDILTGGAITPGCALDEAAILVAQADGQTVEFGFG
ncbi:hypothetical protein D3C71_1794910 [compost metagenome]